MDKTKKKEEVETSETKEQKNTDAESVENAAEDMTPEKTAEEKLTEELTAQKEAYLRLAAEYDNYRKRTVKEREDIFTNAKAAVFEELIPVLDNFDRALSSEDADLENFKKGVEMTHSQLAGVFEKFGIKAFGEAGEQFDPNIHNAVMHIDDENLEANVITDVFQKGYKAGEKVLRPAMVKVAN